MIKFFLSPLQCSLKYENLTKNFYQKWAIFPNYQCLRANDNNYKNQQSSWHFKNCFLDIGNNYQKIMYHISQMQHRHHKMSLDELPRSRKVSRKNSVYLDVVRKLSKQSIETDTSTNNGIIQSKKIKITDFIKIQPLGRGMFGQVFLAAHSESGFVCAIKIIAKKQLSGPNLQENQRLKTQLIREIKIQSFMDHPNIIKLYSIFDDDTNIYLVMEAGTDGHMFSLINHHRKLSEQTTSYLVRQLLLGVKYMHENDIIHRDIKLENVILTYQTVKICDFGWSVHSSKDIRSTICGTPLYFSPELLNGNNYDRKVDNWAVGIIAHELITGENPFHIKKKEEINKIKTESIVMNAGSQSLRSFIFLSLEKIPENRLTIQQMLKHPFIRKYEGLEYSEELCSQQTS